MVVVVTPLSGTQYLVQCRSTNDPHIAQEIKSLVSIPHFISPMNMENDLIWIFMGAPGPGASMHVRCYTKFVPRFSIMLWLQVTDK